MIFSCLAFFSAFALSLLAVATSPPVVAPGGGGSGGMPTTACCASTEHANSAAGSALLGLLGINLSNLNVLLALTCSPISVVGVGSGSECSGPTVNCSNGVVGSIGIGCVPVTL